MAIESLTARQRADFVSALMAAFRSYQDLNVMMQLGLNVPIEEAAAPGPSRIVSLAVVNWAEMEGRLEELIAAALGPRPKNPKLKAFAYEMLLNTEGAPPSELEAIVKPHVPMQDPAGWRAKMERLEGSVCRIEMPRGEAAGSGFLIADDLIMTNCHVAEELARRRASPSDCIARFGYRLSAGGDPQEGEGVGFADEWLVDSSPVADLDYAVIRLTERPGRPHVPPPQPYTYSDGDIYLILQHPLGEQMKLSAGVFDRVDLASNRVSYTANTNPGSSGSPVFNIDWNPVALHHAGTSAVNTGVILNAVGQSGRVPQIWNPPA